MVRRRQALADRDAAGDCGGAPCGGRGDRGAPGGTMDLTDRRRYPNLLLIMSDDQGP